MCAATRPARWKGTVRVHTPRTPRQLRADYRVSPIGLDLAPVLTWEPAGRQTGYRLECVSLSAAGTPTARFAAEQTSAASRHHSAIPLTPATRYRWRVRTRTDTSWSDWSPWASFETALLDESDWRGAHWIRYVHSGPAPILSTTFSARGVGRPRLYVCGLGIANVRINDRPASPAVLDPPPSAFDATVWYRALDVSNLLTAGPNSISVRLGRGYYAMTTPTSFHWHTAPWHAEPKLRALLLDLDHPTEPILRTTPTWTTTTSPVIDDSLYTGEIHDYAAPAIAGNAVATTPPRGTLRCCPQPPVTRRERIEIVAHHWTAPDRQRFDLAQNVAGLLTIRTADTSQPTLLVKLGEKLGPDGAVLAEDGAIPGELQRSELIRVPADRPISLDLSYAGMRHVEVVGTREPVTVEVDRISAAGASVGQFRCSDDRLNAIHDTTRRTLENCLQGIPVDTPLYEKQGYTGDAQLLAETYAYNYWLPNSLASWLTASVLPSQSPDGSLPGIAPTPPGNWIFDVPSPAWDAALFEIPATLLRHYADQATVRRALPTLRRYLTFLDHHFPSGIITTGLGDWNAPGFIAPPEQPAIVATAYHFRFRRLMSTFLDKTGDRADAIHHATRANQIRDRFNATFWSDSGYYTAPDDAAYRETNNVLPLAFGLVPASRRDQVLTQLTDRLRARDLHLDTGIVGTRFLLPLLTGENHADLAFAIARNETYPGWLHWIDHGATTLHENWELDGRSHNHAMFGTIDEWFYRDVAGLSPAADGWSAITVDPHFPPDHRFQCEASLHTLTGPVHAEWEKTGRTVRGRVIASVNVPVHVPDHAGLVRHARHPGSYLDEHVFEFTSGEE